MYISTYDISKQTVCWNVKHLQWIFFEKNATLIFATDRQTKWQTDTKVKKFTPLSFGTVVYWSEIKIPFMIKCIFIRNRDLSFEKNNTNRKWKSRLNEECVVELCMHGSHDSLDNISLNCNLQWTKFGYYELRKIKTNAS